MIYTKPSPRARFARLEPSLIAIFMASGIAAQEPPPETSDDGLTLEQSGNSGTGVFHLNQTNADASNQDNILSVATAAEAGAALADANSSQSIADLSVQTAAISGASITDVANAASGVIGINQSAASGSSQANAIALAFTDSPGSIAIASATSSASYQFGTSADQITGASVRIDNLGNGTAGIMQANQIAGSGGRQSNLIALASAGEGIALADATALTARSTGTNPNGDQAISGEIGSASFTNSFNGATGLVQVNQATGGQNIQTNLIAAAFGSYADASAISETGLGDVRPPSVSAQEGDAEALENRASPEGSFDGFVGVGQVSQVVGFGNQTANTVSVSVSHGPVGQ